MDQPPMIATTRAGTSCIEEAALLVAGQMGAPERIRRLHRARDDGSCRGCGDVQRTRWPCVVVAIAALSDSLARGG